MKGSGWERREPFRAESGEGLFCHPFSAHQVSVVSVEPELFSRGTASPPAASSRWCHSVATLSRRERPFAATAAVASGAQLHWLPFALLSCNGIEIKRSGREAREKINNKGEYLLFCSVSRDDGLVSACLATIAIHISSPRLPRACRTGTIQRIPLPILSFAELQGLAIACENDQ